MYVDLLRDNAVVIYVEKVSKITGEQNSLQHSAAAVSPHCRPHNRPTVVGPQSNGRRIEVQS